MSRWLWLVYFLGCSGGVDTDAVLDAEADADTDADSDPPVFVDDPLGTVFETDNGDGTFTSEVVAIDTDIWVYFSFALHDSVEPATPEDSTEWDLGFKRFEIMLNGGASGTGGAEVAILEGADFASITEAPPGPWETDLPDDNGDGFNELAMAAWFDYDLYTHLLTPADRVYVVHGADGLYYKLDFQSYYALDNNAQGHPTFTWAEIPAAATP